MANEIIKYQTQNALVKKADNYLAHLNALMPKKYAPDLPELIPYRKGDLWGFCDRDKNIVIECKYNYVKPFCDELALVDGFPFVCGYIDTKGREVVPLKHLQVKPFSEGLACVEQFVHIYKDTDFFKGLWGFVNKEGIEVIPCKLKYDEVSSFSEGLARVHNNSLDEGIFSECLDNFIDINGNIVLELGGRYSDVSTHFSEGLLAVNSHWSNFGFFQMGYIDKLGNEIIDLLYNEARPFKEGIAIVAIWPSYGFINKIGEIVIPICYSEVNAFSEGLAAVKFENQWKFIDKNNKTVIDLKYEKVKSFSEGLAAVTYQNKWGFIDKMGNEIITCQFDDALSFNEGLAGVNRNSKWGFIDKSGLEIIPFKYSKIENFENGLANVSNGFIDKHGNEYWGDDFTKEEKPVEKKLVNEQIDDLPF